MRSRSSKNSHRTNSDAAERPKEDPHLSGAYIRSLVKKLGSSKTREPMCPRTAAADESSSIELPLPQPSPPPQLQPPAKKQVRRRLHTSRPYQERLLNMAEARKEIVTALKLHRESMKQASEQKQLEQRSTSLEGEPKKVPNPAVIFPPDPIPQGCCCFANFSFPTSTYPTDSLDLPYPLLAPLPLTDNLNLTLPLGLNLNFQGFNNIETPFIFSNNSNPSPSSPSPATTMSSLEASPPPPASNYAPPTSSEAASDPPPPTGLHPAMDDDGLAEIRSIGRRHDMEWDDAMNLATFARWCKFLGEGNVDGEPFNSGSCELLMPVEYLQDTPLPRVEFGDIDGLEWEWFS